MTDNATKNKTAGLDRDLDVTEIGDDPREIPQGQYQHIHKSNTPARVIPIGDLDQISRSISIGTTLAAELAADIYLNGRDIQAAELQFVIEALERHGEDLRRTIDDFAAPNPPPSAGDDPGGAR